MGARLGLKYNCKAQSDSLRRLNYFLISIKVYSMISGTSTRRLLASTLALLFILSTTSRVTFSQRRRIHRQASVSAQRAPNHKLPPWTKQERPKRTYDVLHYTIATRFDVPKKTVL